MESIGHYRIVGKLGEGGMGQVFRATDTTLGRDPAVKVLPEGVAEDPDRMARFTCEAQVLASLNHRNMSSETAATAGNHSGRSVLTAPCS
jgi:serine/threonine protein kinase